MTYTPAAALDDGSHTVTIDCKDHDGNAATQKSTTYTVDTVPPTLNVTSPTDNLVTASQSLTVAGITNDETSSPTTDERVAALEDENAMLKTQVSAQSDQMDFYEDCITERALNVYFTLQKGSKEMMAMLFAQRVILGKTEFEQMPAKLKM